MCGGGGGRRGRRRGRRHLDDVFGIHRSLSRVEGAVLRRESNARLQLRSCAGYQLECIRIRPLLLGGILSKVRCKMNAAFERRALKAESVLRNAPAVKCIAVQACYKQCFTGDERASEDRPGRAIGLIEQRFWDKGRDSDNCAQKNGYGPERSDGVL